MGPSLLYVWICKSGTGGRCPWQPVAVRGAARLRGRIWNPPLRALCSKVFLRSYCSTPPLKRKIKFFFKLCRLLQYRRRFFSAVGGVVIRRTFSAGAGRRGLESAAQFSTGCIVIGGTVCRAASFIQVVILHTFPGRRSWNPPHSLRRAGLLSAAQFLCGAQRGAKNSGCYRAHNSDFVCGRQVVIHSTICAVWKIDYCYRQHNSDFGRLSKSV